MGIALLFWDLFYFFGDLFIFGIYLLFWDLFLYFLVDRVQK
jgi:hypothetical protein